MQLLLKINAYLPRFYCNKNWVRDVSVWGHFGQTMKSCRNLTCSYFNANILKSM